MRNRRPPTGFGRVLREYAEARGIVGWKALAEASTKIGYNADAKKPGVSSTAVTNWATGLQSVPNEVLPYLERLLELDQEQKQRLAWVYAWEQRHKH